MRFDWYSATVPASLSHCKNVLSTAYGDRWTEIKPQKPFHYGHQVLFREVKLFHGGHNPMPFVQFSGQDAERGASVIRSAYPEHRVARADVAIDFDEAGGFDRLLRALLPVAKAARLKIDYAGDWSHGSTAGKGIYFGSTASDCRAVLYTKGLQMIAQGVQEASEHWYRFEWRVRPRKQRKALSASLSECELMTFAKWGIAMAQIIGETPGQFRPDPSIRQNDDDQSFHHMLSQYARVIRSFHLRHGQAALIEAMEAVLNDE